MSQKIRISLVTVMAILFAFCSNAQMTSPQIDQLVEQTLKTFDVPGIAVAVIKDGKVIHSKGYGVRSLNTKQKVDEKTLFGIASNSKAFTATALGILVDEKKIKWDDAVMNYIPEFRLYSPYVSDAFTIKDLLTHRSGLGLGAGDLMFWPDSSDFALKDLIHNLRYLKQVSGFRTKFDYDNLLYVVAGEVVARVSGTSWEEFIETRILNPLGMTTSAAGYERLKDKSNIIDPHAPVDGKVQVIKRDFSKTANAAGGIYSSVSDMSKWVITQLNNGKYGEGLSKHLFSEAVQEEMWTPQTIIPARSQPPYNTHFSAYGLGWFLNDAKGFKQISHTGGLAGIVTQVILIPEIQLGIIVFTNQQSGAAFTAISRTIRDGYLGIKGYDWIKVLHDQVLQGEADEKKITEEVWKDIVAQQSSAGAKMEMSMLTGTYHDVWFGDVVIFGKNGSYRFDSKRSPRLTGEVLPYKGSTFLVKWKDRSFNADALLTFALDSNGKPTGIKMKAISPLTDFSFDFQDLDFSRVAD